MDIKQMIILDNQELQTRAQGLSNSAAGSNLTAIRQWCWDVISSEEAKVKVLYRQLLEEKSLPKGLHDRLEMILDQSQELRSAVTDLLDIDPVDYNWENWWQLTINLLNSRTRTEASLLNEITPYFTEGELGRLVTSFERAREAHPEIGEFQYRNAPFKPTPRPDDHV